MLELKNIEHFYGAKQVINSINLKIKENQCVAIIGPSGCGKSTLLGLCAGLLQLQSGEINNKFKSLSIMFQQPTLLPWLNTLDNIALALKPNKTINKKQRQEKTKQIAKSLGLDEIALNQYPAQLSGGMQSRAALARALITKPELILLDEPFSALDIGLKSQMYKLVQREMINKRTEENIENTPLSILMITHDLLEATYLADIILLMNAGQIQLEYEIKEDFSKRNEKWAHEKVGELLAKPDIRLAFGLDND